MNDQPGEATGIGHNRPPSEAETREAELLVQANDLIANANRWRTERPSITDEEMAGAARRFCAQLQEIAAALEENRDALRKPFNDAAAAITNRYRDPLSMIDLALRGMRLPLTQWLQREKDRLAAARADKQKAADAAIAEAARLAHEAEQPGATVQAAHAAREAERRAAQLTDEALSIPTRPQIRDELTPAPAMSLHRRWRARITDEGRAARSYRDDPMVKTATNDAVKRAANRDARLHKDESKAKPGVQYYVEENAQ
jgi:hypothetical protein